MMAVIRHKTSSSLLLSFGCSPNSVLRLFIASALTQVILGADFLVRDSTIVSPRATMVNGIWEKNRGSNFTHLIGGDILGRPSGVTLYGGVCLNTCQTWPKSGNYYPIPYTIEASFSDSSKNLIRWVMDYIEESTDIRFVYRTTESNYLSIANTDQCSSYVGMLGGKQPFNLAENGCIYPGTILHELTHALGVDHEHQRPDRDAAVRIQYANIQQSAISQVDIIPGIDQGQVTPYDYASIMHYDIAAFSSNQKPVLQPSNSAYNAMLSSYRAFYSSCDWREIYSMYPKAEAATLASQPCSPHIAGRGLEPTTSCLEIYSKAECNWACSIASQDFWGIQYCRVIGGKNLPPPSWELDFPQTGTDADPTGTIAQTLAQMLASQAVPMKGVGTFSIFLAITTSLMQIKL